MASRSNVPTKGEEHGDKRITYRSTDPSFNITQGLEECRVWIEAVTGDRVPDFASCCKNGVPLCKLLNCIVPGIIPRINNDPKTPHKERENIAMFLMGCRSMGLQEQMLFNVEDLYEEKNLRTVAVTVHWLGKLVQKNYPNVPVFDPTGQSPLKIGGGGGGANAFASSRPPETPITERDKNRAREPSRIQSVRAPSQVIQNVITCSECKKPLPANRNSFMNQNLYYCRECLCSNCSEPFRHRPKVTAGQNNYCPDCVCFKCKAVIYDFYVPDGNNKICLRCCCNYCRIPLKVSDTPPFCVLCRCHRCQVGLGEVYYVDNLGKNYCEICADEIRIRNSQRASSNNNPNNNNNRGVGSQSAGGGAGGGSPYGGGSQYGSGVNPSNSIYGGPQYGSRASSNDGPGSHHGGGAGGGSPYGGGSQYGGSGGPRGSQAGGPGGAGGSPYGGGSQYGNSPYGGGSQYGSGAGGAGGAPRGSQAGGPGGAGGSPYGGGSQYGGSGGGQPRASQSQGGIQAAHSANAKKQCPGCGSALSGQQVEMDGIRYHKQCFKCDICRSVATVLINGRPYCANCHPDPETCCVCGLSLRGGGLEALGRFYHDNCFKCEICSALLGGRFKELDRKIMCYNCAK